MSTFPQDALLLSQNVLRLTIAHQPILFNPSLGAEGISREILLFVFEGLMQRGLKQTIECAVAESVTISDDQRIYLFRLRECLWSNGLPLTASDFEYAWKKILSPDSPPSPFAYLFYMIKNARTAKKKECSLDEVGIYVHDARTLCIELIQPTPYFLELLTEPMFAPIHAATDQANPLWSTQEGESFVCNGPYCLKKNDPSEGYYLEKNLLYWNEENIFIPEVTINKKTSEEALELFKKDKSDWLGFPFYPWEPDFEKGKVEKKTDVSLGDRVYWCSLNTRSFPLNHIKIRQALALSIDRQKMIKDLHFGAPAFSPLPPQHAHYSFTGYEKADLPLARKLFEEALEELDLTKENLPPFRLIHTKKEKRLKISKLLASQWKKAFGIEVQLIAYDWTDFLATLEKGEFEMASMEWYSPVDHPYLGLSIFKFHPSEFNYSAWENEEYTNYLNLYLYELDPVLQAEYLSYAEAILIREVPLIPLLYDTDRALKNDALVIFKKGATIDFKQAFFAHIEEKPLNTFNQPVPQKNSPTPSLHIDWDHIQHGKN